MTGVQDVCSSDLGRRARVRGLPDQAQLAAGDRAAGDDPELLRLRGPDRKSVAQGKSVDLGGRRIIKQKKNNNNNSTFLIKIILTIYTHHISLLKLTSS